MSHRPENMSECEIKLEAPPSLALPDLEGLGFQARALDPQTLEAVYFDTGDLRLARWGCSLRWRSDEGWTVKLPGEDQTGNWLRRVEQHFEGDRTEPPGAALDLLRAYLRDASVKVVARLRTKRRATEILSESGESLAELDDDEVSVLDGRRIALRFREIEIELKPGTDEEIVQPIVEQLRAQGAGEPNRLPKMVRAVGPRATDAPELVLAPKKKLNTVAEVLGNALSAAVIRVIRHDAGIRIDDGDSEHVHQARVGIRRFRTILKEFKSLFDDEWNQALRKEAKTLADALGDVRDADVLIGRQQNHVDLLAPDERPASLVILNRLHAERDAARDRLLAALRDPGYAHLLNDMVAASQAPRFTDEAEAPADSLLQFAVKAFEKLKNAVDALDAQPPPTDLHRVRILTKRARYVAEALTPSAGKDAARFAKQASALQDVLGELQDATVAGDWLRSVAESTPAAAFLAGKFAGMEVIAGQAAIEQWRDTWDRLDRKRVTAWLSG